MSGYELKFKVFADSQEEADAASDVLKAFVDENAKKGIAITASKISSALNRWKNNPIVLGYFK